jgi:DNA-directed RNA polymerase subunit RPC12/RpoP
MCVCPLDTYTDTKIKPNNRLSCGSRILIDKRRVRTGTSSAENVCVECGSISDTAWGGQKLKC